jgi:hypothetical protein
MPATVIIVALSAGCPSPCAPSGARDYRRGHARVRRRSAARLDGGQGLVDTDDGTRFLRRLRRDVAERRRTMDSLIERYQSTVKPDAPRVRGAEQALHRHHPAAG